jgi:FdhD protein
MENGSKSFTYQQFTPDGEADVTHEVIVEAPVSLTVNGQIWFSFMCTPVGLDALAVGFLFNEGLINRRDEIASIRVCPSQDNIDVWLNHPVDKPVSWRRTSGCTGGITSVVEDEGNEAGVETPDSLEGCLKVEQIKSLVARLFEAQDLYRKTGGVHTSALSDGHEILLSAEDIGRHNTLDKIAGRCILEEIQVSPKILLTTGRISSEMLQKASRIGASAVISRTAPSSLSIRLAERYGITLIGYARRDRFNVYTHASRIVAQPCLEAAWEN